MNRTKGIFCGMIAAFIYGFSPILAKFTYFGGSNTTSLAFYRSLISIPIILVILKIKKIPIAVTKSEFGKLSILGMLGAFLTGLMLYGAYEYISVGLATTIHYIYPVLVTMVCIIFFNEKISRDKVLCLVLSTAGILLFFDGDLSANFIGIALALLSGISYCLYILVIDKSGVNGMHPFKISFYCCLTSVVYLFVFGTSVNQLVFNMTPLAWFYTILLSIFISVLANTLLPIAVKNVGSTVTAILGMIEPISSVILGIIFLREPFTVRSVIGCTFIIVAVLILTVSKDKSNSEKDEIASFK